jgi:diguanylate cyclase (GGDEF)-like protein
MIDIDHFKLINDTYGHKSGDVMIQALSKLLHEQTRVSDIACRYGGEEFILVMPGMSIERAYNRVEQLRLAFETLEVTVGDVTLRSTFSAGIAVYPEHAVSGEELMQLADQALYQAKTGGRNCVKIYESQTPFRFGPYENAEKLLGQAEFELINSARILPC